MEKRGYRDQTGFNELIENRFGGGPILEKRYFIGDETDLSNQVTKIEFLLDQKITEMYESGYFDDLAIPEGSTLRFLPNATIGEIDALTSLSTGKGDLSIPRMEEGNKKTTAMNKERLKGKMSYDYGDVRLDDVLDATKSYSQKMFGGSAGHSVSNITAAARKTMDVSLPGLLVVNKPSGSREFFPIKIPNFANLVEGPLSLEQYESELRTFFPEIKKSYTITPKSSNYEGINGSIELASEDGTKLIYAFLQDKFLSIQEIVQIKIKADYEGKKWPESGDMKISMIFVDKTGKEHTMEGMPAKFIYTKKDSSKTMTRHSWKYSSADKLKIVL